MLVGEVKRKGLSGCPVVVAAIMAAKRFLWMFGVCVLSMRSLQSCLMALVMLTVASPMLTKMTASREGGNFWTELTVMECLSGHGEGWKLQLSFG